MTDSASICCCGAAAWTRVIAWIEIATAGWMLFTLTIITVTIDGILVSMKKSDWTVFIDMGDNGRTIILSIAFVYYFLSMAMGFVLLRGATNEKPGWLCLWLVYDSVFLVLLIIVELTHIFYSPFPMLDLIAIISNISLNVFVIWIVYSYQERLLEDAVIPPPPPLPLRDDDVVIHVHDDESGSL